jgi:hypothetical protein
MPEQVYDEEREDYASLADEASAPEAQPWNDEDWEPSAVANAKKYAKRFGLSWPPRPGDFDRWYDLDTNGELEEI